MSTLNTDSEDKTMNDRTSLLDKLRALMSKTAENGCTEHEALAALDKARAMMDAYEVTDAELQLTKAETAVLRAEPPGTKDPHLIKRGLASAVARFCDCKAWRSRRTTGDSLTFCGLQSDVQFATWLLDNLTAFVQGELVSHLIGSRAAKSERRLIAASFAMGATDRISDRLTALCAQSASMAATNSLSLVVTKTALIDATLAAHNINLRKSRSSSRHVDRGAFASGSAAGDRASFGRPVSGSGATLRIGGMTKGPGDD
jgi:hypothetical protein